MTTGLKTTPLGNFPSDWDCRDVGSLDPFVTSGSRGWAKHYTEFGAAFIRITNMSREAIELDLSDLKQVRVPANDAEANRTQLRVGDVLVSITADIGIVSWVGEGVPSPAYINQHVSLIRFLRPGVNSRYVAYFLAAEASQRAFRAQTDQGAKAGMNLEEVRRVRVVLPSEAEQMAIAAALSDVDALLTKLDQLIAKKRDLKQAAVQQLLTGRRRLPGFAGPWTTACIEELADVDPSALPAGTTPGFAFNYISLEDVDRGSLNGWSEQTFATAPSRARRLLRPQDVLVSTVRPNLQSHLLFAGGLGDWVCSTGFAVLRAKPGRASPRFLFECLFSSVVTRQIESMLTGSNYPAINSGDVRRLVVPAPECDEQAAIASVLADMGAEIAAIETRREKTRQLKQGMMQALLSGRIRLV